MSIEPSQSILEKSSVRFQIIKLLGSGTYGRVYKVKDLQENQIRVIKSIHIENLEPKELQESLNEAIVMKQCKHFNIIQYFESFVEDGFLFIVMEFADSDLGRLIESVEKSPISEERVWNVLIQLASGLKYLHEKRIMHRDLKPHNILLTSNGDVKLADFGMSKILPPTAVFTTSSCGSPLYMSPECIQSEAYDFKSDIWSFGCVIYELCCGKPPFNAMNQLALARKIVIEQPQPLPKCYSTDLQEVIFKMLEKDVVKRFDIHQLWSCSTLQVRIEREKKNEEIDRMKVKMRRKLVEEWEKERGELVGKVEFLEKENVILKEILNDLLEERRRLLKDGAERDEILKRFKEIEI